MRISSRQRSSSLWFLLVRSWNCVPEAKTSGAIRALLALAPKNAKWLDDQDGESYVSFDQV